MDQQYCRKRGITQPETTAGVDRISALPSCIQKDILFKLPLRDEVRACLLSKSWRSIASSSSLLPKKCFCFDPNGIYDDEFISSVEDSLRRLHTERFVIPTLDFRIDLSPKIAPFLDRWLQLAANNHIERLIMLVSDETPRYPIPGIALASAGRLRALELQGCELRKNSLCGDAGNGTGHLALRGLYLYNVVVFNEDGFFQKFIDRCTSLQCVRIVDCWGLKSLQLCNHPELKDISITVVKHRHRAVHGVENAEVDDVLNTVEVDSLGLESITYIGHLHDQWQSLIVEATRCRNLLNLDISCAQIHDEFLRDLISTNFPLLQSLTLRECRGFSNSSILIHPLLKNFQLHSMYSSDKLIRMDTPNLRVFHYSGTALPLELVSSRGATPLEESHIALCLKNQLNTESFIELRDDIEKLNTHKLYLFLEIRCNTVEFDYMARVTRLPTPKLPCSVESLRLIFAQDRPFVQQHPHTAYGALLDGLFWTCRPNTLRVKPHSTPNKEFLRVLINTIKRIRDHGASCPRCSGDRKCWGHSLKDLIVKHRVVGDTSINNALFDVDSVLHHASKYEELVFALSWS